MDKEVVSAHVNGGLDSDSDVDESCCGGGGDELDQRSSRGIKVPSDRKVITDLVQTANTNTTHSSPEKTVEASAPEKTEENSSEEISAPEKTDGSSAPIKTEETGHSSPFTQISPHAEKYENTDVSTETHEELNFDMGDFEVSLPSCEFDIKAEDDSNPKQGDDVTIVGDHSGDAEDEEDKEDGNKDSGLDSDISSISTVQLETVPTV